MKELGQYLKEGREKNAISLEEVSEDLKIDRNALENIEEGNIRAFKDMYALKELVKDYAKYLGLDANNVVEEFNDFLFCYTSKISLDEIKEYIEPQKDEEKKMTSPYTKLPKQKKDYTLVKRIITIIIIFIILSIVVYKILDRDRVINTELKGVFNYELTK